MMLFWIFTLAPTFLVLPLLIWVTFAATRFTFAFTWYMFANVFDSFIYVIILRPLKFKSSTLFRTDTLLGRLISVLQLPTRTVTQSLTIFIRYKLIRDGLVMHWWLFKGTYFVWLEALAILVNNTRSNSLINPIIIIYHVCS